MTATLLHACYGPAPTVTGDWLDVPTGLLRAYVRMQTVVEAQRQIQDIGAVQAGTGRVKKGALRTMVRTLLKRADIPGPRKPASDSTLAAIGVAVSKSARPSWAQRLTGRGDDG